MMREDYYGVPEYSVVGLAVRDVFLADSQDVLFYFEDADYEVVYERFVRRLFPELKVTSVFCLGGKSEVYRKARELPISGKIRVLVVDKDFDDLLGCVEDMPGLFYFDRYSFENYLADWLAVKEIAIEELGRILSVDARAIDAEFASFREALMAQYEKLTRLFVVARRYKVGIKTTKVDFSTYLDPDVEPPALFPSDEVVAAYRRRLQESCSLATNEWLADDAALDFELANAFQCAKNKMSLATRDEDHFCGKHLLGFILNYCDFKFGTNLANIESRKLYLRLLNFLDLGPLAKIYRSIIATYPVLGGK
jgi:hypothetical protein